MVYARLAWCYFMKFTTSRFTCTAHVYFSKYYALAIHHLDAEGILNPISKTKL